MNDVASPTEYEVFARTVNQIVSRDVLGRFTSTHSLPHIAALAASISSAAYFTERMQKAAKFVKKLDYLNHAIAARTVEGLVLEFGVATGGTINHIAAAVPGPVFGFDVFTGLPEDWRPGYLAGAFQQTELPAVSDNVELIVGLFDSTLPEFVDSHPGPVSLLHVDCDLYSSTRTVFRYLGHRIVKGTIILFDEYLNYPSWEQHEFKAFQEYIAWSGQSYEYIAIVSVDQQVGVRITS